jgi:glutaredoxin
VGCPHCKGTGKLVILNVYDPDYKEYEDCPYCKYKRDILNGLTGKDPTKLN